jgi:RimJ/RimL family protein N-acetyltransferase
MSEREMESEDLSRPEWRRALPEIISDRLTLRELRPSDAAALHRAVCTPEIVQHTWPPPSTVEAIERFIEWSRTKRTAGEYICFGIVPRGQVDIAGLFELRVLQPGLFRVELGFVLDPAWWGTGLFSDAAHLVCDFAFGVLGVHRIEARASVENPRGNAALRKIGARKEGRLRAAFLSDGRYVDQYLWSIVNGLDGGPTARVPHAPETHHHAVEA